MKTRRPQEGPSSRSSASPPVPSYKVNPAIFCPSNILGGVPGVRGHCGPPEFAQRLMMWRWISLVPSQMRSTRASRQMRSSGSSSISPMPPWIWIASSAIIASISVALSLAIAMSASVTLPWSNFQPASQVSSSAAFNSSRHVGQLEADALELADLLAELAALGGPGERVAQRAVGAAEAGGGDLQAGGAQPGVGHLEALVHLAQHVLGRHAAVVEFEDRVGIAAVADVAIAVAHGEARRALVDEEGGDLLLLARAASLPRRWP
jgi:hypothetical protein